jgi:hypothetical protein
MPVKGSTLTLPPLFGFTTMVDRGRVEIAIRVGIV